MIVPVYNGEAHVEPCLASLARQTLADIEILCVNDGSTDATADILQAYAARDARFRVLRQENAGPGAARNAGLAQAAGEYAIFLDSDDWFEADFLERMLARSRGTGADVTVCRAVEFDDRTGRELPSGWMLKTKYLPQSLVFAPEDVAERLFQFTYGMAWDKLYRTPFLRREGLRFPPLRNSEDLAFVFPSLLAARRIAVLDETFIHHRVGRRASVSNSRSGQPDAPYEAFALVKAYLEKRGLMARYERSFLNWAMEFLVWHVSNMDDLQVRRRYFDTLRETWLPQLRFERHPAAYYEDKWTYAKYLLAKYAPYALFSAALGAYGFAKNRVRGRGARHDGRGRGKEHV